MLIGRKPEHQYSMSTEGKLDKIRAWLERSFRKLLDALLKKQENKK
jgi:hypothetical protein